MKECNLPNEEATTKMPERGTPNNGGVEDKAETPLCLQIKIHWLLSALVIAINLISISVVVRAIYRIGAFGPEGERVLGVIFPIVLLIIFDAMTLPVYKRHRVIFEPRRLTLQLGGLAESLRYSDIISISEKDVYTAAYQWRPTGTWRTRRILEVLRYHIHFGKGRLYRRIPVEAHRPRRNPHSHENVRRSCFARRKRGVLRRAPEAKSLD